MTKGGEGDYASHLEHVVQVRMLEIVLRNSVCKYGTENAATMCSCCYIELLLLKSNLPLLGTRIDDVSTLELFP